MRTSSLLAALLVIGPANLPAQARTDAAIGDAELTARLGAALDSLARVGAFSGVVVIGRAARPVVARAYGFRDREGRLPNDTATAFNLGSINKVFTATAIRQLAADGRLHLDSTLAACWPDYPNPGVARQVTIRQLLAHQSGIGGDIFAAPAGGKRGDLRHNRDFLPLFVNRPLEFAPGSRQEYSNAGYVVLGALVERLSGTDYYEYVRRHILEPARMTRTGHWPVDSLPANTAKGYTTRASGPGGAAGPNTDLLPGRGSAAGGGYATAGDLLRFVQALREGRIRSGPPPGIGAAGGAPGLNAVVEGALPGGYDVVVLANLDPPAAQRVARLVRGWLRASD